MEQLNNSTGFLYDIHPFYGWLGEPLYISKQREKWKRIMIFHNVCYTFKDHNRILLAQVHVDSFFRWCLTYVRLYTKFICMKIRPKWDCLINFFSTMIITVYGKRVLPKGSRCFIRGLKTFIRKFGDSLLKIRNSNTFYDFPMLNKYLCKFLSQETTKVLKMKKRVYIECT